MIPKEPGKVGRDFDDEVRVTLKNVAALDAQNRHAMMQMHKKIINS